MPIGATIGAAVVGAGGAVLASSNNKSAANHATDVQQQSANQQLALQSQIYQQNSANEQPYLNSGYGAQEAVMQLLGLQPQTAAQFNSGVWSQPGSYKPVTQTGAPIPATPPPANNPAVDPSVISQHAQQAIAMGAPPAAVYGRVLSRMTSN